MFDVADHLDELRSWPALRLRREHDALVREQRRLRTKELAVLRVLDERGQIDPTLDASGESARTLVPHGPWALVGNPNLPDGIRRVHLDDLSPAERRQAGLPPRRAGPNAA